MSTSPLRPVCRPARRSLAALAVSALVGAVVLAGCSSDDEPDADPASGDTSSAASTTPTDGDSPSDTGPGGTPSDTDAAGSEAKVYFATEVTTGVRLVAEPTALEPGSDVLAQAADLALSGAPTDPDYRNAFAGAGIAPDSRPVVAVVEDDDIGALRVQLSDGSLTSRPKGMSAQQAKLAVQALVYTVQGVAQSKLPLQVVDAEDNPTTLLGVDTSTGVRAARPLSVLSLVNVLTPADGATVSGKVDVTGLAASFEGTVPWQLLDGSGKKVLSGSGTGSFDPRKLTEWTATVDLSKVDPGTYLFVASTDDPSGGAEGPGPNEDTKSLVVE